MSLLDKIKTSMRITHPLLDEILTTDIYAAALDMSRVGVKPYNRDSDGNVVIDNDGKPEIRGDELIHKAIELFVKSAEDFEGKGEQYAGAYEKIRDGLSLCGDWNE